MKGWTLAFYENRNEVHIVPNDDLVGHEETEECVCLPKVEALENDSGEVKWVYIHSSLDQREANE